MKNNNNKKWKKKYVRFGCLKSKSTGTFQLFTNLVRSSFILKLLTNHNAKMYMQPKCLSSYIQPSVLYQHYTYAHML